MALIEAIVGLIKLSAMINICEPILRHLLVIALQGTVLLGALLLHMLSLLAAATALQVPLDAGRALLSRELPTILVQRAAQVRCVHKLMKWLCLRHLGSKRGHIGDSGDVIVPNAVLL